MRIRLESVKRIGNRIGLNEEKGFAIAILLALIIVVAVIAGFFTYSTLTAKPVGYNTIYLLDENKKAVDYPEVLVANQNSTFSVYVDVENHMRDTASYQVKVKIAQTLTTFPRAPLLREWLTLRRRWPKLDVVMASAGLPALGVFRSALRRSRLRLARTLCLRCQS